jgi:hypothetical protein
MIELVNIGRDVSTGVALAELDGRDLRACNAAELLALGAMHRFQGEFPTIIALGQYGLGSTSHHVVVLFESKGTWVGTLFLDGTRFASLLTGQGGWDCSYHFAAVSK